MTKVLNETRQYGSFFRSKKTTQESFKFSIPAGETFHSCRLTILDAHFGGKAKLESMPDTGRTGKGEVIVSWDCPGSADIKFQVEAFSVPTGALGDAAAVTRQMTGFLPSRNGWPFDNRFQSVPPFKLIGELRYGDASKGLCGGMVYSALDYFVAGLDLPQIPDSDLSKYKSPVQGPVFDYFGKRLFNSFDIPAGVWSYVELMRPDFPEYETASKSAIRMAPRSRAWRLIRQEWPIIKTKLDTGQPCPLGLVRVISKDLKTLGQNHQVLAYGYDLVGDDLTLFIYDPNCNKRDDITLKLNIASPERKLNIKFWDNLPVYCFFQTHYTFSLPPAGTTTPGRIILFEDPNFCGKSIDIIRESHDLSTHKLGNFNNTTSSFVILSGEWNFYLNAGFDSPVLKNGSPLTLGPGSYNNVADLGIQDNEITSLRAVNTTA